MPPRNQKSKGGTVAETTLRQLVDGLKSLHDVAPRQPPITPHPGPQEKFLKSKATVTVFGGSAGGGKAIQKNTPVPTAAGWKEIGELVVGDVVFDIHGKPCRVIATTGIEEYDRALEFTFSDGAKLVCDHRHLWYTMDTGDRFRNLASTDEWRANRRANRPRRGKGKKPWLGERNSERAGPILPPPSPIGYVRSAADISKTILDGRRTNHSVVCAGPLDTEEASLPMDPYVLGAWLGDGSAAGGSGFTSADEEIVAQIRAAGFHVEKASGAYRWNVGRLRRSVDRNGSRTVANEFTATLREMGLVGNKHIPEKYLRASIAQRIALLQGLCDTDGSACKDNGSVEFTNTNKRLFDGFIELLLSLGIKARGTEGRAMLNGVDCGPKHRVKFFTAIPAFRLKRKAILQKTNGFRGTHNKRYIKSCREIGRQEMCCIAVDSETMSYLVGREMIPTHNSMALHLKNCLYAHVPGFTSVLFRRVSNDLRMAGGLWLKAHEVYPLLGGIPREDRMEYRFPSGALVRHSHMEHEHDRFNWQGSELCHIGWDEVQSFSADQFWFLFSRNRSTCGVKPFCSLTCNPDPDSFIAPLVEWWIDPDTGLAIPERSGVVRYLVRADDDDRLFWGDTADEARENASKFMRGARKLSPISFTFIHASLADNPTLVKNDPEYEVKLSNLPLVERERLLGGNWKIRHSAGKIFNREWFGNRIKSLPEGSLAGPSVRGWDLAASAGGGDRTASVKVGRLADGKVCVLNGIAFRKSFDQRNQAILDIARSDGFGTFLEFEQDPGGAGKEALESLTRQLIGFIIKSSYAGGYNNSRINKWTPAATMAEAGNVVILDDGTWDVEDFVNELHNADGTNRVHDDYASAFATALRGLGKSMTRAIW